MPINAERRKPRDDEIDVFGITHAGKVRPTNQDQFLLATVHRRVQILSTSLSDTQRLPFGDDRLAFLAMVADGVGGGKGGERASATALEIATQYVVSSMNCYYGADASEEEFFSNLRAAAMRCHAEVLERAKDDPDVRRMATTLTLLLVVWPYYYLLQVGDSRYYQYLDGKLTQVTRDQTMAQDLVDEGVFTPAIARRSQFSSILSSSIGGEHTEPRVSRLNFAWGIAHLLCSDGLTKHVPDEQIAARLEAMTSARQVCEQLVQDALDNGGSDNITVVVGRALPSDAK